MKTLSFDVVQVLPGIQVDGRGTWTVRYQEKTNIEKQEIYNSNK